MPKRLLLVVPLVLLIGFYLLFDPGVSAQVPTALLVTNSLALGPGDAAIKTRLEGLGFSVMVMEASATNSGHALGKAVVLISSSAPPLDVNTKFRDVVTPVMTWQSAIYDDMKMTYVGDFGTAPYFNEVVIEDPNHPMAAGLSGVVTVTTAFDTFSWGEPPNNVSLVLIATLGVNGQGVNIDKAGIFGYEQGVAMVGMNAPGRRLGMFMTDNTAASFTADGWKLFDAAVSWVATQTQAPIVDAGPASVNVDPRDTLMLNGTLDFNDDGLPDPPSVVTYTWSLTSGPAPVTFGSPNSLSTSVTFAPPFRVPT